MEVTPHAKSLETFVAVKFSRPSALAA